MSLVKALTSGFIQLTINMQLHPLDKNSDIRTEDNR